MRKKLSKHLTFILYILNCLIVTPVMAATFMTASDKTISKSDIGHGTPLVLIHAFPSDQRLWKPQQTALSKKFRVITLDLWGFGQSSPVSGEAISMNDYADEVKALLDQLHIAKAVVGGESMGGYVALAFLEKYPAMVNGLILSNTQAIPDNAEQKTKREETAIDVLAHGTKKLIDGFMPKALTSHASEATRRDLREILDAQSPKAMASALRGMAIRTDMSNTLANTPIPILIISGDKDQVIPAKQSEDMHRLAKNSQLTVIPDAAHLTSLEYSSQWNDAVIKFFDRHTGV